jgi:hypothetical protein
MSANEVTKLKPTDVPAPITPMDMLDRAISQGANIDVLEKLMSLQERWEKNQGRKAFDEAMASAKAEITPIIKNRTVSHGIGKASYQHEDLAQIARAIDPILSKHGLSYRFRTDTQGNAVAVTCIISHRDGHSEANSLSAAPDASGSKNSVQAIGSTLTYLQRYALKAALGLASSNDDDARVAEPKQTIDAEQAQNLRDKLTAAKASEAKFLKWARVERIEDIRSDYYDSCNDAIMNIGRTRATP